MDNSRAIEFELRKRDSLFMLRMLGMLLTGFVLSLLAPLFLTMLYYWVLRLWSYHYPMHLPWVFGILAAICCISLYRLEWLAQGGSLQPPRDVRQPKPDPGSPAETYGHLGTLGAVLAHKRTPMSAVSEIFLFGPQMVIAAVRKMLIHRRASGANRKRIVEILSILMKLPSGAATDKMLAEGEAPDQLSRALSYLLFYDWIGISRDGTKVWALTETRREMKVPAPAASA
ncbi:MAG TPA: hypothetical protein VN541_19115 [Tepidisphaeraceae bacterium]|nr:hypothetical protein [Tepidisphaeraceae bacterium]